MAPTTPIYLVLPKQSSPHSDLYNVYNDLALGLRKLGAGARILLVRVDSRNADFPYGGATWRSARGSSADRWRTTFYTSCRTTSRFSREWRGWPSPGGT
ncbi:MAG: hypothetical protein ACP5LG_05340 [Conexivisphaera sp.]